MASVESSLDADEHLALALRALRSGDWEQALAHLELALERDPDHGPSHHLRGGLYAGMRRFDLAIPEMERAVELEADPAPARFELGMLHLCHGRIGTAREIWKPLAELGEEHALFLFQRGMLQMVDGRFDACLTDLERGLDRSASHPALSREMRKVIERVRKARGA